MGGLSHLGLSVIGLSVPHFSPSTLAALVVAASFAGGLNVYAMVLTLGLLARFNIVALPPGLESLGHTWVIVASGIMFALEFVADKIPGFDMIWNALHTVVRAPIAALVAWHATNQLSPETQALAAVAGGGIALLAHSSKTAVRAVVTPSPEPVSNVALSTSEDVFAIGLTWFATTHPYIAGGIALVLTVVAILSIRWAWRAWRRLWERVDRRGAQAQRGQA